MSAITGITRDGKALVTRFGDAEIALKHASDEKNRAECELANAITALGKFMCPDDAKQGEKFSIWMRDSQDQERMLEVTYRGLGDYHVAWRSKRAAP